VSNSTSAITENPCLLATALNVVECRTRPLEALKENQVRVQTEVSMVSPGTELHHLTGTHTKKMTFPSSIGYISVGKIIGRGGAAPETLMGKRVLVQQSHFAHHNADADKVKLVPDGVDPVDAATTILLGIGLRGIRGGSVRLGDSVVVFGLGVIGLYAMHLSKVAGAYPVIAVDPVGSRRDIARQMGADIVIDPIKQDAASEIRKATGGEGTRVSIDASGTPKVIATLPDVTAEFGKVVVLGGVHGVVPFDLYTRFQKSNLTMVGCGTAYPQDYPYTADKNELVLLQMIAAKRVLPRPAITHVVPWKQGAEIYRMLIHEKDKIIGAAFDWRS
jgi:2-desacetyl-2-hydroxyethyl bacteriochlorophyllide A dehydrogenase